MAVNGQPMGPFNLEALRVQLDEGQISATSLVWTPGMAEWAEAGQVNDLASLFISNDPPPIPV